MKTFANLALVLSVLLAADLAHAQVAVATLSGTTSQGSGGVTIAFSGNTLKTDGYFGNLDSPSKAAYILCCDADPTRATIATANLIDGLISDTHGSFVIDFDLSSARFWDNAFSGGDLVRARSRLAAALVAGQAHFVVISAAYPNPPGEISGRFAVTSSTSVSLRAATPSSNPGARPTRVEPNQPVFLRSQPGEAYGFYQLLPSGTFAKILPGGGNDFLCSGASERCVFPVYVSSFMVNGQLACEARVDYGTIRVPPHRAGKTIRIVWLLVEGDIGDTADYRFMDSGIELAQNDPRQDFNGKGRESADGKRYKWLRVGTRIGRNVSYQAWVERFDPATGASTTCKPADPTIANSN